MATGLEALGAASAVLQVISFASNLVVACKNAYDGATTSEDDLERHSKQLFEAASRVHSRCERMAILNLKFADPKLQNIAEECMDATEILRVEVQYVTSIQAKRNIFKSVRKAVRTSSHQRKLRALEESLSRHQQLIQTELTSHLCSQSDAMVLQQEQTFNRMERDVQFLINQIARGVTDVLELVVKEHVATRATFIQETARVENAINRHTNEQMLNLKTANETDQRCKGFLQSLKAERMNQRYTDVMDPKDASFNQVLVTYQEGMALYCQASGDVIQPDEGNHHQYGSDNGRDDRNLGVGSVYPKHGIWSSWKSFISWLQSDEKLFYIEGKPGSGKSTLVKFIADHDRTIGHIHEWNPDAIIIRHFFWKLGSHEQNSIKGLWCSLLYQRLQGHPSGIPDILQHFKQLSLHDCYHDWTVKDLQAVWEYAFNLDNRYFCIFIDGLDEIRNEDGFSQLIQSVQLLLEFPRTKLCVSTRPEARIIRWLEGTSARGLRLEDLTKHDMMIFVQRRLRPLLPRNSELCQRLRYDLVRKAQGVFLWLHLAIQSLVEGIENDDPEALLLSRIDALPDDLETLYMDMWQRLNANNSVYRQTAARYFRYVLLSRSKHVSFEWNENDELDTRSKIGKTEKEHWHVGMWPFSLQVACAESPEIQERILAGGSSIEIEETLQMCEATKASIRTRCAGLLELKPLHLGSAGYNDGISMAFAEVAFIHRTAHDFLIDTEAGRRSLGHDSASALTLQCGLLKGLICGMVVSSSHWTLNWILGIIIDDIIQFPKLLPSSSFIVATEVLGVLRSFYDKGWIKSADDSVHYRRSFFTYVTHDQRFDNFVISGLAAANNIQTATDTLRDSWVTGTHKTISKRLFQALITLGADPHQYGTSCSGAMPGPFVSKETAFTNFLVSFYCSREGSYGALADPFMLRGYQSLRLQNSCEILETAIHLAKSCNNFDTSVALVGCSIDKGAMVMQPLRVLPKKLQRLDVYSLPFIIYEVNLQFLLLYLLSTSGEDSVDNMLGRLGSGHPLQKADNSWIKIRYLLFPKTGQEVCRERSVLNRRQLSPQNRAPVTCHRVASRASLLPKRLIECLLCSPVCRYTEGRLFKLELDHHSKWTSLLYNTQTDVGTITHVIEGTDIEEVSFEAMFTSLAHEIPEISPYDEAGIFPSVAYLRRKIDSGSPNWCWFPLLMERLQTARDNKEPIRYREDISP